MLKELYNKKMSKMDKKDIPETEERVYSSMSLSEEDLPSIRDWSVGEEYTVVLRVRQKSMDSYGDTMNGSFDILEVLEAEEDEGEDDDMSDGMDPEDE